jgi:mannan endo-1,4-beta-mannosidase
MRKYLSIIAATLVIASCGGNKHKADDPLADSGRTQRTENLLSNLKQLGDSAVYLFGHQDDTLYGIGWSFETIDSTASQQHSDIKSICNDYPALVGFDITGIEQGTQQTAAGMPLDKIRQEAIRAFSSNGLVTLSLTISATDNTESLAAFLNSLETPYGVRVPVLLRLRGKQSKEQWQSLSQGLKDNDVTNALFVYAPAVDSLTTETKYMEQYPGDDVIDIMGISLYCDAPQGDTLQVDNYASLLDKQLTMLASLGKQHSKPIAVAETGYNGIKTDNWWTQTLAPILQRHPLSYVLLWSNTGPDHFFVPYPGHHSTSDFVRFYNLPATLFRQDINGPYNSRE